MPTLQAKTFAEPDERRTSDDVFVSATTADLLEGSGVTLEDAGSHELKGLIGRRQVLRVTV